MLNYLNTRFKVYFLSNLIFLRLNLFALDILGFQKILFLLIPDERIYVKGSADLYSQSHCLKLVQLSHKIIKISIKLPVLFS